MYMYVCIHPSGADVCPKFHWGFSYVVVCLGSMSVHFGVYLGLVWIFFRVCLGFIQCLLDEYFCAV